LVKRTSKSWRKNYIRRGVRQKGGKEMNEEDTEKEDEEMNEYDLESIESDYDKSRKKII